MTAGDDPLAEDRETWEVEIFAGAHVLRTRETAATSVIYAATEPIADFGAPLGAGDALDLSICQLSALVGQGPLAAVTLTL